MTQMIQEIEKFEKGYCSKSVTTQNVLNCIRMRSSEPDFTTLNPDDIYIYIYINIYMITRSLSGESTGPLTKGQ